MFDITIYIETSFRGPANRTAAGMYLIEYMKKDGEAATCQGMVCRKKATENALALEALTLAFCRLSKTCCARVSTRCEHILNAAGNLWIPQWEKNDWKTAKGKPVKNADFWKEVAEAKRKHVLEFVSKPNGYGALMADWMERGIRELEAQGLEKAVYTIDLAAGTKKRILEEM